VFRVLALATVLSLQILAAYAADILPPPTPDRPTELVEETTRAYLENRAVLLSIRATFNVLDPGEIEPALVAELGQMASTGPSQAQLDELNLNLLTEGSYYLVSLEYLVRAGGAAWPSDRPGSHYDNDALVLLDGLKRRLVDAVDAGADTLPIFIEAQRIMALTNGEKGVPPGDDLFGRRDAMVKRALKQAAPWTRT
jgi:hypothetical protein